MSEIDTLILYFALILSLKFAYFTSLSFYNPIVFNRNMNQRIQIRIIIKSIFNFNKSGKCAYMFAARRLSISKQSSSVYYHL